MCLIGMDAEAFLSTALQMANSCRQNIKENPGLVLGAIMGQAQVCGIDKLTIFTSPSLYDFGAWLEQLVVESTGKVGKAIIPVDQEVPGDPSVYGTDRLFVFVKQPVTAPPMVCKMKRLKRFSTKCRKIAGCKNCSLRQNRSSR